MLSNLERCWRPQDLTKVRGYRASVYRSQITSSAFDPAVVAQMCSPITHLHPSCSLQVIDGKLAPYLSKVIKFASSHVFSCSLCREKGFICELCHNGQVLYPFQDSSIKRWGFSQIFPIWSSPYSIIINVLRVIIFLSMANRQACECWFLLQNFICSLIITQAGVTMRQSVLTLHRWLTWPTVMPTSVKHGYSKVAVR